MDLVLSPIGTRLSVGTPTTMASGLTAPSHGLTGLVVEVGGQTVPLGDSTAHVAEADSPTAPSGGPPAHPTTPTTSLVPRAATTTLASPFAPCVTPTTSILTSAPHAALMTPPAASLVAPVSPPTAKPVPCVLPADAVPISPVVHPHPMWTRGAVSFRQPKLYVTATLSLVLKSVRFALTFPHWWAAMEEECATLMSNNNWDLVLHPCSANVVTDKWIFKHKFKVDGTLKRYKAR
jgi:hypothetical protein